MKSVFLLMCSQEFATEPSPDPVDSSSHPCILVCDMLVSHFERLLTLCPICKLENPIF